MEKPFHLMLRYGLLSIFAFLVVCPLAWLGLASMRPQNEIFQSVSDFGWHSFIPSRFTFDNYATSCWRSAIRSLLPQ